ncbi:hypothetical protein JOQ06_000682 [Pogonophryne albipinna]|uniref:Uncharacterized protein n=1 Tax=Pogonophryne albipinna TaxID=1090488 RepID=A0AAD6AGN5_9TELE|nr:hypothetical protein JOQ06_000682 [Pogonophryne albipinna]
MPHDGGRVGPLYHQSGPLPQPALLRRRVSAGGEFISIRSREPRPDQQIHSGEKQNQSLSDPSSHDI